MKYFVCAVVVFAPNELSKAEQPYIVKNEGIECYKGFSETLYDCDLKLVGRKRLINGTIAITKDMASDHYSFQVDIFASPLGLDQYKLLPMGVPRMGICEFLKNVFARVVQPSFVQTGSTNFPYVPKEGLCPLPKGDYYVKDMELDTDSWPNQLPRGLIKVESTAFKDGVKVGGGAMYFRIEDPE